MCINSITYKPLPAFYSLCKDMSRSAFLLKGGSGATYSSNQACLYVLSNIVPLTDCASYP